MSGSRIKSSSFFLSLTCFMILDKSLNLSVTYFPICKMRLIIILAYFAKVLEEWIITVFITTYVSLWGKDCFFFLYSCNSTGVLVCNECLQVLLWYRKIKIKYSFWQCSKQGLQVWQIQWVRLKEQGLLFLLVWKEWSIKYNDNILKYSPTSKCAE